MFLIAGGVFVFFLFASCIFYFVLGKDDSKTTPSPGPAASGAAASTGGTTGGTTGTTPKTNAPPEVSTNKTVAPTTTPKTNAPPEVSANKVAEPVPQNCVGDWLCSVTCGSGPKMYHIYTQASNGGAACPFAEGAQGTCDTGVACGTLAGNPNEAGSQMNGAYNEQLNQQIYNQVQQNGPPPVQYAPPTAPGNYCATHTCPEGTTCFDNGGTSPYGNCVNNQPSSDCNYCTSNEQCVNGHCEDMG